MISFISHNFIFVCINVFAQFCFLTSRNACLGRCFMWMWCECDVSDIFQKHEYVMWCECDVRCSCFIERLSEARWCDCMNTIRHASRGWHAQPSWRVTSMMVCDKYNLQKPNLFACQWRCVCKTSMRIANRTGNLATQNGATQTSCKTYLHVFSRFAAHIEGVILQWLICLLNLQNPEIWYLNRAFDILRILKSI